MPLDPVLAQGGAELEVPLTAHPSGKPQGTLRLSLRFKALPAEEAAAAARADMAGARRLWGRCRRWRAAFARCHLALHTPHAPSICPGPPPAPRSGAAGARA